MTAKNKQQQVQEQRKSGLGREYEDTMQRTVRFARVVGWTIFEARQEVTRYEV